MSSAQQDIIFHQLRQPEVPMYNIGGYVEFCQALDVPLLTQCAQECINGSAGLHVRLHFNEDGAWLRQVADTVELTLFDVSLAPDSEQQARSLLDTHFAQVFKLDTGPLLRVGLIRLSPQRYWYFTVAHHLVIDGWGYTNLQQKIFSLYSDRASGTETGPGSAPIEAPILTQPRNGAEAFWRAELAELPPLLFFPGVSEGSGSDVGRTSHRIERPLSASWFEKGKESGSFGGGLPFFLGALFAAIGGLYGHDEMTVGVPIHNRRTAAERKQISLAMQVYPTKISGQLDQTFDDLCVDIARRLRGIYRHTNVPLSRLFAERDVSHGEQRVAIFDIIFNYQKLDFDFAGLGLQASTHFLQNGFEQTPLTFTVCDYGDASAPLLQIDYHVGYFDQAEVEALADVYCGLLQQASAAPGRALGHFDLLTSKHREQLQLWHPTPCLPPADKTFWACFAQEAERAPGELAVQAGEVKLSYAELEIQASSLAARLQASGVVRGDRVAVLLERSVALVVTFLATLKVGAVYVPLDTAYPSARLQLLLADANPQLVVTTNNLVHLAGHATKIFLLDQPVAEFEDDVLPPAASCLPSDPAYMIYTSGSTGMPKGVVVTHENVVSYLHAVRERYNVQAPLRVLQFASVGFDIFIEELCLSLLCGGSLHLRDSAAAPAPEQLWAMIESQQISALSLPTAYWHLLCDELSDAQVSIASSFLRLCVVGGEAMRADAARGWLARMPGELALFNSYGPTEATIIASAERITAEPASMLTIGLPLNNTRCYIVDRKGRLLPPGFKGELWIGGAGVACGYWQRADLNQQSFLFDPFNAEAGARIYRSGDLVSWRGDGHMLFHGRIDQQVKILGFRIETGEIAASLRQLAHVRDAHVTVQDGAFGKQLIAYVVLDELDCPLAQLAEQLKELLPEQMVPRLYMALPELPLTPNGKLDHKALRTAGAEAIRSDIFESARNESEQILAEEWGNLLAVEAVSRRDNFFSLGGNSLLAMRLVSRLRERGLTTRVEDVFRSANLADLAQAMSRTAGNEVASGPVIAPGCLSLDSDMVPLAGLSQKEIDQIVSTVPGGSANIQDIYGLSPQQKGFLFEHLLEPEADHYVLSTIVRLPSASQLETVLQALRTVICRQDALRTLFLWEGLNAPVQVVLREAELAVFHAPEGNALQQLRQKAQPGRICINLQSAPLLQVHVASDGPQQPVYLLLLAHHIIGDHSSQDLLVAEVQQLVTHAGVELPRPARYRDFISSLYHAEAEERARSQTFFEGLLGDFNEPSLPFRLAALRNKKSRAPLAHRALDSELAKAIRNRCRLEGVTPVALFHLVWALLIAKTSGSTDIVFGTVFSGRLRNVPDIERMFGPLINTLPFRLRLDGMSVEDGLQQSQNLLRQLIPHEHANLVDTQRCSCVAAPMPLFTAALNYVHTQSVPSTQWEVVDQVELNEWNIYPLSLTVEDLASDFSLYLQCDQGVDTQQVLDAMQATLEAFLCAIERSRATPLLTIGVLPQAERTKLLQDGRATLVPAEATCLHQAFALRAASQLEAVALIDGERQWSYGELERAANGLAQRLQTAGVMPGTRVGLCLERSGEVVVGILAILKCGASYVPLDPIYPGERIAFMLGDAAISIVLAQASTRHLVAKGCTVLLLDDGAMPEPDGDWAPVAGHADDQAYVIYTSGSTGQPKGVMVSHANVARLFSSTAPWYRFNEQDCWCLFHSYAFDVSVWEIWGALLHGGRLVVVPRAVAQSTPDFYQLVRDQRVTVLNQTPSAFYAFSEQDQLTPMSLALRTVVFAGEALALDKLQSWFERHSDTAPELVNMYGITETTVHVSYRRIRQIDAQRNLGSLIGRPIPDLTLWLLDAWGEPVPTGVVGELCVGGAGVAGGYLNRPELTAERFVAHPELGAGERLYRSGDLARYTHDGELEYLGRSDHQVKIRGFRIELGDIESALRACTGVADAVVLADSSPAGTRLVAYVQGAADGCDSASLRTELAVRLPDYMVPSLYISVTVWPLTANGKLDRRALPAPDMNAVTDADFAAPEGEVESTLAAIWQELLGVGPISRHSDFFALGGHSLLAMRLTSTIRDTFYMDFSLNKIFEQSVLHLQAGMIATLIEENALSVRLSANVQDTSEGFWL
ncbi:hypothetical protein BZG29_19830 [Janthinobacterium sp. LM6]|nr:hypothetical protein BZG29_19830 [Janthinobacterium sp. LM6]